MSKRTLLTLGASGVLALGIAVPTAAMANDRAGHSAGRAVDPAQRQQKLAEGLAKELGIDQTKVADALKKVEDQLKAERPAPPAGTPKENHLNQLKSRLAEAVQAGKLTQAEADAITKAAEAGLLNGGPRK